MGMMSQVNYSMWVVSSNVPCAMPVPLTNSPADTVAGVSKVIETEFIGITAPCVKSVSAT